MENISSSLESILQAAVPRSTGAAGGRYLAGGFLMISSFMGLIIIIGAFWYHRNNLSLFKRSCFISFTCQGNSLMSVQVIHNSLVFLLFMDAVNLITAIILGADMVGRLCYSRRSCFYIKNVWFLSRWLGVILHLLSALLSIYHLCHQPLSVTRVHIVYSLIGVLIGIIIPLYVFVHGVAIFILTVLMFLFALSVIVRSTEPTLSPSTATPKKLIMVVSMCNFLLVYIPTFILHCLLYSSSSYDNLVNYIITYVTVLFFSNLHLIFDGFLCALLLKFPSGEEQQQQLGFPNPGHTVSTTENQQ